VAATKLAVLKDVGLFTCLHPEQVERLSRDAVAREFQPGQTLFLEGEPCQGLWLIGEGVVQIVKTTPQGRQMVLATQTAPATVAEVPVFDGGPYPASVTALQPTLAVMIHKQDFLLACRAHPALALHFLEIFGRRLRHLVGLAERITFGTIRQRLAQELLERAEWAGADEFAMEETQEQLATRLGTVREVISRNISRFQSEGLLRLERRSVSILNRVGLEREAATEM
jgi:CRP/FNR family transcriptional regulator